MSQQRKFFPGWLVVASGFVIMPTCYTIFVNCMSLFQPLIVSDLGITLAQYNISNAISTVVSVIGSLVIGHVADKDDMRKPLGSPPPRRSFFPRARGATMGFEYRPVR